MNNEIMQNENKKNNKKDENKKNKKTVNKKTVNKKTENRKAEDWIAQGQQNTALSFSYSMRNLFLPIQAQYNRKYDKYRCQNFGEPPLWKQVCGQVCMGTENERNA